jgi:DNA polymerase III epsilon subunit-like protein
MDKHVVIDLETMSTRAHGAILSIGAVLYEKGVETDSFSINIDPKSSAEAGCHFSKDTIDWWAKQSEDAKQSWKVNPQPLKEALEKFIEWYGKDDKYVWGYGANFDIVLLEESMFRVKLNTPWRYYNIMCLRTLTNITKTKIPRLTGTHHNALDDARNQGDFLIKLLGQ